MAAGLRGREPIEGKWGFGASGSEDENRRLIDDEFRRRVIVKKAKRLFVAATAITWLLFVGLSVALFYLGPLINPTISNDECPRGEEGQECSGRGACPGVNGTVCFCPIEWEGERCERFSGGIVVFAVMVTMLVGVTTQNAWRVFRPGAYDGGKILPGMSKMQFGK
jgi:hypothetical protein